MKQDPRQAALLLLLAWEKSSFTLDHCLEQQRDRISALFPKDRNLFNALVFGVLRHRLTLDWIIEQFSNITLKKISPSALYILRLILFQFIYMDRIPAFAAINTGVEIAKQKCGKKTAGFINAVSRKSLDHYKNLTFPDKSTHPEKHLSVKYAFPMWLIKTWILQYGFENTKSLCRTINTIPYITVRANTLKSDRNSLIKQLEKVCTDVGGTGTAPDGIHFQSPESALPDLDAFQKGFFQVQDEAAQLVTLMLDPEPGETVLDACAGLGGKTGHIGQIMKNSGNITALDVDKKKLEALKVEAARLGIKNIDTRQGDILKMTIKNFDAYFDRVLVDAPCTGLGVMRRNPDAKWRRKKSDILNLAGRQKKILNAASSLVRPGGILVYAVCSCENQENQEVVHSFLKKRKDFSIDKQFKSDRLSGLMTREGFLKTYPDNLQMDGFFAARLKRKP